MAQVKSDSAIIEDDIESFSNFVKYVSERPELESRFILPQWKDKEFDDSINLKSIFITSTIKNAIERYLHLFNEFEFDKKKAQMVVDEIQNFIFCKTLPIDIVVPILFVKFDFEKYEITDGVEVRRLTKEEQLARFKIKSYSVSVNDSVLSSATHALVLKDWQVKNSNSMSEFNILTNIQAYPIERIDKFFGAVRVARDFNTGYAQVLSIGKNWIHNCKANLPHIEGTSIRSFPSYFENYYWNVESIPSVSTDEIVIIGDMFIKLLDASEKSIDLAVNRLNQCLVRDKEEDSVLDATIALEALLSDDGNQEMTHKLAMRVGALSKLSNDLDKTPQQSFKDIKSIYGYRSAIVHGSKKLDKKRVIKIDDQHEITAHSMAVQYLKAILSVLINNPEYRDPKNIDSVLLPWQCRVFHNHAASGSLVLKSCLYFAIIIR